MKGEETEVAVPHWCPLMLNLSPSVIFGRFTQDALKSPSESFLELGRRLSVPSKHNCILQLFLDGSYMSIHTHTHTQLSN